MADAEQAPGTPPWAVPANPFPGLRPFEITESDLFFGREREIRELLSRLRRNRFLAVVGASGCGKSSLIRAGLLAALRDGFLAAGGTGWRIASLRPGDAPLLRLAEALDQPEALGDLHAHPEEVDAVLATLRRGARGLVEAAAEARLPDGERLLVFVDQFEELFRFAAGSPTGAEEARAFAKLLTASVSQREAPVYVVLTMRSDFLGHCASLPGLPEAINQSLYLVPQMGRDALREVVKAPVERAGAQITERLVNRLLNDLGSDSDQLPILQHALMRIWHLWSAGSCDGPLDLPFYEPNALEQHLEEVYGELPLGEQATAERLFRALTEMLEEGRMVRRPTRLGRIAKTAGYELADVATVVERFRAPGRSFLMPPVGVPLTPETVLDISHESLIRQWPRLARWAAAEAGAMQTASDLTSSALRWRKSGEEASYLFHGQRLAAAEEWDQAHPGELGELARDFLRASVRLRKQQELRRQEQELPRVMAEQGASLHRSLEKGAGQVFLAYAHQDEPLARQIAAALRGAGREVWLDEESITPGDLLIDSLRDAILQADAVVCLLSPEFLLSGFIKQEVDWALQSGKRLVPVLIRDVDPGSVHPALAPLQWLDFRAGLQAENALDPLLEALGADVEWVQMHTRLLLRATEWRQRSEDGSLLLRGNLLAAAEQWLARGSPQRRPAVTSEQTRYILASRLAVSRKQRRTLFAAVAMLVVTLALSIFALRQRNQALVSQEQSRNRARAAIAANLLATRPTEAALVLLEVHAPDSTPAASETLYQILNSFLVSADLVGHTDRVVAASFSPNGTRVVTASEDKTARIWNAATGQPIATLTGHTDTVIAASFSPDGTRVVTASWDKTARIWNVATGQPIATLIGHTDKVLAASFSPDGTRVVTASADKMARVWSVATGQPIATLAGHTAPIFAASFSPDGTRVVTASWDKTARIWNAATGQPVATLAGHAEPIYTASFSPDGIRVVTASADKTARIWNAVTGQPVATLAGHAETVFAASFSPDGTRVVTASADKTARIWNAATGEPATTLTGHVETVFAASFSPDGTRVVTASADKTARIWNAATGEPVTTLTGHVETVFAASFSPDGTRVVTASADKTARIWNASTGQPVATLTGHTAPVWTASFSPDGTRMVTASADQTARVWNAATGQPVAILTGHSDTAFAASFSPDGTRVVTASADKTARVWNAATGQPIATLTGHTDTVWAASFSPDGTRVVTASEDHTARIWSAINGQPIATLTGHTAPIFAASFSLDGTRVVTASADKTARIWNAATGQPMTILNGHAGKVGAASFSPDGARVVTASVDKTARVWNAVIGQSIAIQAGHTDIVLTASFSPDGTRVVTASADQTARVWNAVTGQPIATLTGHTAPVSVASFSPDGTRVVTASEDQTARIWNATTGQPVATLTGHTAPVSVASFSPDGTRVVTASEDRTARIWASGGDFLQSRVRALTPLCLQAEFRKSTLGENAQEAESHEKACTVCVPKLFSRLKGVPSGDSKTYLAAWKEYQHCFDDAL